MKSIAIRFALIAALGIALFVPALTSARAEGPFPGGGRPPMPPCVAH
jgi:hypothetical protein